MGGRRVGGSRVTGNPGAETTDGVLSMDNVILADDVSPPDNDVSPFADDIIPVEGASLTDGTIGSGDVTRPNSACRR